MTHDAANSAETATLAPAEIRYLVLAAQREGNRQLNRQLAESDLTTSQAEIIMVLHEFGPLTLRDLGGLIVCEMGSPSRIVDSLVQRKLVTRSVDEHDRRAVSLSLSPSGESLVHSLSELDSVLHLRALAQLSPTHLEGLVHCLRSFLANTPSHDVLERRFAAHRTPIAPGHSPE